MLVKLRARLFHVWFLLSRPMTLGVRVVAQNSRGEVLLVRHTYVPGWHFPGGGVEKGETIEQAAIKEMREETGYDVSGGMKIFHVYANRHASKRDHVALLLCEQLNGNLAFRANREIAEVGFFPLDALPQETTPATRRRLRELFKNESPAQYW